MNAPWRGGPACRSLLYVPAHKATWVDKAEDYGADALLLDLEDSVPLSLKDTARAIVQRSLQRAGANRSLRFARVNPWGSGLLLGDLDAIVGPGLTGVFLAKVESPADITALDAVLSELEVVNGLEHNSIEISPVCETAGGVLHHYDICMASTRIRRTGNVGLAASGDLTRALGIEYSDENGDEGLHFNVRSGLEARAAGISHVIGGMTDVIGDLALVERLALRARSLGATGTTVLHPSHVPIANTVFSPNAGDIAMARSVFAAFQAGLHRGDAAVRHRGRMIDYAHARTARDVLRTAASRGLDIGDVGGLEESVLGDRPQSAPEASGYA